MTLSFSLELMKKIIKHRKYLFVYVSYAQSPRIGEVVNTCFLHLIVDKRIDLKLGGLSTKIKPNNWRQ